MPTKETPAGSPPLRLEDYFAGHSRAWGMFEDRFGNLQRQFEVEAEGSWDGQTLVLVEDFHYSDGQTEKRTWRIEKIDDVSYRSQADGMIGQAEGRIEANTLGWHYTFSLDVGQSTWRVRLDDWIVRLSDDVLVYRSKVSKFGVRLGQVTMVFLRDPNNAKADSVKREAVLGAFGSHPRARGKITSAAMAQQQGDTAKTTHA